MVATRPAHLTQLDGGEAVAAEADREDSADAEYGDGPVEPETQAEAFDAEPFDEPLEEDTFRLAKESGADGEGTGREAGREDEGEAPPRGGS